MRSGTAVSARARRLLGIASAAVLTLTVITGCVADDGGQRQKVVRVPQDAHLEEAGSLVAPGGVILISPGTYHETLEVHADDVTVRGKDRNRVILDGQLTRSNGIVATGKRVAIENLTVRNFLQNGVLVTGITDKSGKGIARGKDGYLRHVPPPVPGYLVQYVTATDNGLYGIYALNRTGGVIRKSLASGGADSGIYVGQCGSCRALVEGNVVVSNAVGMEFANASDVLVTGNRIVRNRVGVSVLSNHLEANAPGTKLKIVGNVIADNNEKQTPVQARGAFGIGIGLGGSRDALVTSNRIAGNSSVGLWVTSSEDFSPTGNRTEANVWSGNGLDVAYTPSDSATATGNCFGLAGGVHTSPAGLGQLGCGAPIPAGSFTQPTAPPGIAFADVPLPPERPGLASVDDTPRKVPDVPERPTVSTIPVPDQNLLAPTGGG